MPRRQAWNWGLQEEARRLKQGAHRHRRQEALARRDRLREREILVEQLKKEQPEEWLAARRELLAKEKELTRLRAGPRHRRADRPGRRLEPGRQCLASPATLGPAIRPRHYGEVCS